MVVNTHCPKCGRVLAVPEEFLGKKGTCHKCGSHVLLADTRVPCPNCRRPVFIAEWSRGSRTRCPGCRCDVVLSTQPGMLSSALVPVTPEEFERRKAREKRDREEAQQRAERLREESRRSNELEREKAQRRAAQAREPIQTAEDERAVDEDER